MTTAQRLAWLEGLSTLGVLTAAITVWLPPTPHADGGWALAARVVFVAAVCIASFYFNDLYDFETPLDLAQFFVRLCRALGWSALVLAFTYVVFPETIIQGNLASQALLVMLVAVLAIRAAVYALAKRPPFTERVLILGGGPLALDVAEQIRIRPDLALTVVGFVGDGDIPDTEARVGGYHDMGEAVRRLRPDRIIVAMADRRGLLPVSDLLACRFRGIRVEEAAHAYERFTRRLAVETLSPSALIFGDGFRVTRTQLAVKRALSVVISAVALVLAAPMMAVIALLIRLDSPGPAFFIQDRVGLHGKSFRLIKFRTMRVVARDEEGVMRDNESRVTRVGRLLRRYRLDEIPQFINILRGDMSLVGPRPEIPHIVDAYCAAIPYYGLRREVRPGLTGWAQVKAGYTMGIEETKKKLCFDLYYIKHMSVRFDLAILFDTVKFVLSGKRPG
jgi:sugar transferase (PEP-CTERM system associated)